MLQVALVGVGIRSVGRLADEVARWACQAVPKKRMQKDLSMQDPGGARGWGFPSKGCGFTIGTRAGAKGGRQNMWAYLGWQLEDMKGILQSSRA